MNLNYLRENSGALTISSGYSGFWTAILVDNMPNLYVAGIAMANFGLIYHGYNSIKDLEKEKEKFRSKTFSNERNLDKILED